MYKGESLTGKDFFDLLFKSDEFTVEMGKVALAAGKLEAELMSYLERKGINRGLDRPTLGKLISIGKEKKVFDKNLVVALEMVKDQRNYLTHNIYALLTGRINETILEGRDLIDTDVLTYKERAWQLKINLTHLADIISKQ